MLVTTKQFKFSRSMLIHTARRCIPFKQRALGREETRSSFASPQSCRLMKDADTSHCPKTEFILLMTYDGCVLHGTFWIVQTTVGSADTNRHQKHPTQAILVESVYLYFHSHLHLSKHCFICNVKPNEGGGDETTSCCGGGVESFSHSPSIACRVEQNPSAHLGPPDHHRSGKRENGRDIKREGILGVPLGCQSCSG